MVEYSDRTVARRGIVATVVAAALNAALVPIARALELAAGFEPIAYTPVVFLTVLSGIAATVVFGLVRRLSRDPARTYRRIAAGVLVVSFVPDLILLQAEPAATVPGVLVLLVMHVLAAVVLVGVLTRGLGSKGSPDPEQPRSAEQ